MRRIMYLTWKKIVIRSELCFRNSCTKDSLVCWVISNWTGRLVFCCNTIVRDITLVPCATSRTLSFTRSQPRSLLSIARLNKASSFVALASCNLIRIAQISLSLSGGFCPMSLCLFHGSGWFIAELLTGALGIFELLWELEESISIENVYEELHEVKGSTIQFECLLLAEFELVFLNVMAQIFSDLIRHI